MAANDASERFPGQGVLMLVIGAVLSVLTPYLLQLAGIAGLETGAIASTVAALPAAIGSAAFKRRRGLRTELASLSHGMLVRPVALVIAIVAGSLLVIVQVTTLVTGFTLGIGLGAAAVPTAQWVATLNAAVLLVAYPIITVVAFFVGRRASHYFRRRAYAWLLVATMVFGVLQVAFDAIQLQTVPAIEELAMIAAFFAVLYGAMALGTWFGLRRHEEFLAGKLLRKLPADDLHAVTALIGETVDARLRAQALGSSAAPH